MEAFIQKKYDIRFCYAIDFTKQALTGGILRCLGSCDDLEEKHLVDGREVMHAYHLVWSYTGLGDLRDGQC